MKILNNELVKKVSGGFVKLDMEGNNVIVALTHRSDSLMLTMPNQNAFWFNRGCDGLVTCSYYIDGRQHFINPELNLFNGQNGFFGADASVFQY